METIETFNLTVIKTEEGKTGTKVCDITLNRTKDRPSISAAVRETREAFGKGYAVIQKAALNRREEQPEQEEVAPVEVVVAAGQNDEPFDSAAA